MYHANLISTQNNTFVRILKSLQILHANLLQSLISFAPLFPN